LVSTVLPSDVERQIDDVPAPGWQRRVTGDAHGKTARVVPHIGVDDEALGEFRRAHVSLGQADLAVVEGALEGGGHQPAGDVEASPHGVLLVLEPRGLRQIEQCRARRIARLSKLGGTPETEEPAAAAGNRSGCGLSHGEIGATAGPGQRLATVAEHDDTQAGQLR
jgi:hypothetical protein